MTNPYDQFDSAAANPYDQFDEGKRKTPTEMRKIGREGFGEAMTQAFREGAQDPKSWLPVSPKTASNLAAIGNFPRQMIEGGKQYFGREDPEAIKATEVVEKEDPMRSAAGGLLTLGVLSRIPGANTFLGQTGIGTATGALMPTDNAEARAFNTVLGGGISGLGYTALSQLGKLGAKWLSSSTAKAGEQATEKVVRDQTLAEGRQLGYVVPGSATGERGMGRKAVESVAGKGALNQEASIRNQAITNKVAKSEAGLKPDEPLNEASLAAARERIAEPYRQISQLSPKAAKSLEEMKQARLEAKTYHRHADMTGDPKSLKAAQKFDAKADAAEKAIEAEAVKAAMGQGAQAQGLVQRLREARIALAKNYDVERALKVGTGDVDAHKIGQMINKRGEASMTGGLATIGKFANTFPDFTRVKAEGQVGPGIGALKPYAVALGLAAGANEPHAQHYGVSPYMLGAAGLTLAGGPARSLALSRIMQGTPEYAPGMASRAANYLTNDPNARRLIPLSAVPLGLDAQK